MTCAVSLCVCIASIVTTAEARLANAFRRSRTAGIRVQGSFLSCRYLVGMLALTVIT